MHLCAVGHVGRFLDGRTTFRPAESVKDGDLILLIDGMLRLRGLDTVRISKVRGHAGEAFVRAEGARDLDRLGNNGVDEAADFGRRRVPWWIIDARRNFCGVCARWHPVVPGLHRFLVAIARAVVNHDGEAGTSLDPMVLGVFLRGVGLCMRFGIGLFSLVWLVFWDGWWVVVAATPTTYRDIELWPYSVSMSRVLL